MEETLAGVVNTQYKIQRTLQHCTPERYIIPLTHAAR